LLEDRGRKTLEENNYSKEEVEKELESVYTTKAYILQLLGKTEDSIEIYSKVLDSEPNNLSHSIASAANNIVTLTYTKENFFESSKRLLRATKVPDDLLSPRQKKFILFNQALLAYHGKQNQRCQTLLKEIQQKYPNEDFPKLVLAAIHYRERQYAKSDSTLSSLNSFTGIVSRAAITITTGNNNQAIEILESQNMVRFDPAVVSILAQLYEKQGNSAAALKAYDDAIQFHSKAKNVDQLRTLRMKSATFKYHKNMFPECVSDFENLYSLDHKGFQNMPFDALSCMVIASSKVKSNIASKYAGELPPIPGIESISLEELEQKITVPLEILRKRGKAKEEKEDTDAEKKVAKKKKNRKKRFPKNFDPEKPGPMPDPERWLPRWQRSSSKKKMSKKARESMVFKGAQGAGDSGNIHSRSSSGSISLPQSDAAPVESSKSSSSSKRSAKSSKKKGGRR
jgi:signal recognition particle subunit SRP72